jgi:hypothetical protein
MDRLNRRMHRIVKLDATDTASPSAKILAARSRQARPLSLKDMRRDVRVGRASRRLEPSPRPSIPTILRTSPKCDWEVPANDA